MNRQPATWLQISAHRFQLRRMEHALLYGNLEDDTSFARVQRISLAVGAVLAILAFGACLILA
ncbi:MAG: type VII secretion protein EccB [Mycobacterium sp.]|nr:type VII secretion protein EccB [Mycobacterium sp.]